MHKIVVKIIQSKYESLEHFLNQLLKGFQRLNYQKDLQNGEQNHSDIRFLFSYIVLKRKLALTHVYGPCNLQKQEKKNYER